MRIDPSQLSEPLAHILGASTTDAAGGQRAAQAAKDIIDPQLETLDVMLLRRLQAQLTSNAASSVLSYQDALDRINQVRELTAQDPAVMRESQSDMDPSRIRDLLH